MDANYTVNDNKEKSRFETALDNGEYAFVNYRWISGRLALIHTEVPASAGGKGIASILARHVLEYAKQEHLKIIAQCSFIAAYIKKHPEYEALVDEDVKG